MTRAHFGHDGVAPYVALSARGKIEAMKRGQDGEDALMRLDSALRSLKRDRTAVTEIAVDHGPGRFSAVRSRVALASGLAAALGAGLAGVGPATPEEVAAMPAKSFRKKDAVLPLYDGEPNITVSKKGPYVR